MAQAHQTSTIAFAVAALGIATFSTMDALMRGATIVIGAYNTVFWRTLIMIPLAGFAYLVSRDAAPTRSSLRLHLLRGVLGTAMAVAFFWGLARMPMAEGVALSFIAPIISLYLAALLLGEKIGRQAIAASLISFAGVLLIAWAQLGKGAQEHDPLATLAVLASAALYAYNIILMRQQAQVAGAFEIPFFQGVVSTACLALLAPQWAEVPGTDQLPALIGAAVLACVSLLLLAWAYRRAEAQLLANVEYSALVWAMLWDTLLFDKPIQLTTIGGGLLIVSGCLLAARPGRTPMSPAEAPL
jgi:S-adenosylmethionine uptake transporter